jgi:uncharacterized protein involved in cysteine biosynthesis
MTDTLQTRALEFAKHQISEIPALLQTHIPQFTKGVYYGITGLKLNLKPETDVNRRYWHFIKEGYLPVIGVLFGIFATFAFFLAPITVALVLWAPGLLWQLFTTISAWSLKIAQKRHPLDHGHLFIEGVKEVDPNLARDFEYKLQHTVRKQRSWFQAITESFDRRLYFWAWSFGITLVSLVPGLGAILSVPAQTYMVAHKMATRLLDTYFKIERMNSHQKLMYVNKHWSLLIGFCLPYVLLSSIPIVGSFIMVYAEVAVARPFYYEIFKKETAMKQQDVNVARS